MKLPGNALELDEPLISSLPFWAAKREQQLRGLFQIASWHGCWLGASKKRANDGKGCTPTEISRSYKTHVWNSWSIKYTYIFLSCRVWFQTYYRYTIKRPRNHPVSFIFSRYRCRLLRRFWPPPHRSPYPGPNSRDAKAKTNDTIDGRNPANHLGYLGCIKPCK